jgi:hypothetical protein
MYTKLLTLSIVILLFLMPKYNYAQAPNLGGASSFALFTAVGAFNNNGTTAVVGDIGTNVGLFSGFPPGTLTGQIHVADATSATAAAAVEAAYSDLSTVTCGVVLGTTLGNGQLLTPNVYCAGAASTLNGNLTLDGQGNPNALFIFKIDGMFSTSTFSSVTLINGASFCNVYWQVNGEFILGDNSVFRGTVLVNGAISLLQNSSLYGRCLSRSGAISLHNNTVSLDFLPIASVISAIGPTTFCAGDSVLLSGNIGGTWNTGQTTTTLKVKISGDYFVTNTTTCGSINSNHIIVTVNPIPVCNITGDPIICQGQSTQLCVPSGSFSYLWSNGEMTNCINITTAGTYTVTATAANGCKAICSKTVSTGGISTCSIVGNSVICSGQTTQLCVPSGASSYLWSNGETTNCITTSAAGTYSVTVTNTNGCSSICTKIVTNSVAPICTVTGNSVICPGETTQLCVPSGASSYLWSNGETTNCITTSTAGTYSVTVTSTNGCSSICTKIVTNMPVCIITGNDNICIGQSTQFCVPSGASSYLWSNGATTNCITTSTAGTYSVTTTDGMGVTSTCSKILTINLLPPCSITGNSVICSGQTTQLCTPTGFYIYTWSTGSNSNCITVNTAGTYSVTVTNVNGCSSVCTKTVTNSIAPVCSITGNSVICQGQTTQLCTPTGASSYLWSNGETTNCITTSTAGTYSVTVTNTNGCSSTCTKTVTGETLPICSILVNGSFCSGQILQLCTPSNPYTYSWSTGASSNCISINTAGTYSVSVTSLSGCTNTSSTTVANSPVLNCSITGLDFICEGQSATLCVPVGDFYQWSTGETTNCITVSAAGTYFVTVTNTSGCSGICSKIITTKPTPLCYISGNDIICQGQQTTLCIPFGASYLWSTNETTSCINILNAGLYTATATNTSGCSSICSKSIIALPTCSINGKTIICEGEQTSLCVQLGAASYLWNTGATSNCIDVTSAGTYTITVTQTNGCSSICSKTIVANPTPTNYISGNCFIQLCAPLGVAYVWNTGATTNCINVNSIGNYSVTVTSEGGCTTVIKKVVEVNPMPLVQITGKTGLCQGETTALCASAGFSTYLWNTGATTNCINVTIAGNYSVTATNSSGCSAVSNKTVSISPIPNCTITGDAILVSGSTLLLCGTLGKDYTYQWSTGEAGLCIAIDAIGVYSLTTTQYGCAATCSKTISLTPPSGNRSTSTSVEDEVLISEGHIGIKTYPNPFNTKTTIEFQNISANSHVVIELYASGGNKISTLFDKDIKQGIVNKVELDSENLTGGVYICKIINGSQIINEKLILIK